MSGVDKQLLRECRNLIQSCEWEKVSQKTLVFRGLATLHLGDESESEKAYIKATQVDASQVLAWQGLEKLYTKKKQWSTLADIYTHLADIALQGEDAAKCGNALTKIVSIQREHGSASMLADALSAFVPGSKYFGLLETLPAPDQSAPASNPAFNAQMLMHAAAIENALELVGLYQQLEKLEIDNTIKAQQSRLSSASAGMQLLRNKVTTDVLKNSRVPGLLELVRNHPRTDDALRRHVEGQQLRHYQQLALAVPVKGDAANPQLKEAVLTQARDFAYGFVVLQVADELAWDIFLDWNDFTLHTLPYEHLTTFVRLFPNSSRTLSLRALLCLVEDVPYKRGDAGESTRTSVLQETDLLQLALDGLEKCQNSLFAQRVAILFYLLDKDYVSALDLLNAAHRQLLDQFESKGIQLPKVHQDLYAQMAISLTFRHPFKHLRRAQMFAKSVLDQNPTHMEANMAQAHINKAKGFWPQAKEGFAIVMRAAQAQNETRQATPSPERRLAALDLSPDLYLETETELTWCLIQLCDFEQAQRRLEALLQHYDNDDNVFGPEFRARLWWQLGRCYWAMGGTYRNDTQYAYRCYITAVKRSGAFAPAFTGLGEYYETAASPPDLVRASKCFQKAFEMDATEYAAAQRLLESFANQRDWDLVDVIARRVIEAEGGIDMLSGRSQASMYTSQNAWVWKAIGIIESMRGHPEQAIVALQVALRSTPEDIDTWVRMGEAYMAYGRPIPAIKTFGRALELARRAPSGDADTWHIYANVAKAQHRLGRFDRAAHIFHQIVQERPEQCEVHALLAETRLDEARRLLASGYAGRAHAALVASVFEAADALRGDKLLNTAWKVVGDACFLLSKMNLDRALDQAEIAPPPGRAAGIRSVLYELMLLLSQLDVDARLPAVSAVHVGDVIGEVPAQDDLRTLPASSFAQHAVLCYKFLAAAQSAESKMAVFACADLAMALARLATALPVAQRGNNTLVHEQSVQCVRFALSIRPQTRLWLLLGNLHFSEDAGIAQHAYIMAIESSSKNPVPWCNLGFLYLSQGDAELAEQAFLRAQTIAPDWPISWLGRALILGEHSPDLRARLSLFEHAYLLSEGSSLEADYGFALAAYARLSQGVRLSPAYVIGPLLALNHYVARKPLDVTPLHLSALLAERLGAARLATERIERGAECLETEFEATESPVLALKYGIASMNLGRIRLGHRDAQGAIEALSGAQALLDEEFDNEALPITPDQLVHARLTCGASMAYARFLQGEQQAGIEQLAAVRDELLRATLPPDTIAISSAEMAVLLARMRWHAHDFSTLTQELDAAYVGVNLFAATNPSLTVAPSHALLITTRAAAAAALGDTAQYNTVLAQYAACLPEPKRVQLRNIESTAKLSIWQLVAAHLARTFASPETTTSVRVFVAETLVRLAAEHVARQAPLPRLALPSGDGSVLGVARAALASVAACVDNSKHWSIAHETVAVAEMLTLRVATYLPPEPEPEPKSEPKAEEPPRTSDVAPQEPSEHGIDERKEHTPKHPAPPSRASAAHHAARAVHLAPWCASHRRVLHVAHGPL